MSPRSLLAGLLLALVAACGAFDEPETVRPLVGAELVDALRDGGHVLYLRHAETPEDGTDQPGSIGDCSRQRLLTDAGRADARAIGEAVRALGVPVGAVLASPYCRTVETAELAFGRAVVEEGLVTPTPETRGRSARPSARSRSRSARCWPARTAAPWTPPSWRSAGPCPRRGC